MTLLGCGDRKSIAVGHFACQQTFFSLRQRALHRGPEVSPRPLRPPCPQVQLAEGGIENMVMFQGLHSRGFLNRGDPGGRFTEVEGGARDPFSIPAAAVLIFQQQDAAVRV